MNAQSRTSMETGIDRLLPTKENATVHDSVFFYYCSAMHPYALANSPLQIVALLLIWAQPVQMVFSCTCCQQERDGVVRIASPSCCVAIGLSGRKPGEECPCGCWCLQLRAEPYCSAKISKDFSNDKRLAKSTKDILAPTESVRAIRLSEHGPSPSRSTSDRRILLCRFLP